MDIIKRMQAETAAAVAELEQLVSSVNTFDLLANVMMIELLYDPNTYTESSFEGKSAFAEYVAQLLLRKPVVEDRPVLFDGPFIERLRSLLQRVFISRAFGGRAGVGESHLESLASEQAWEETLVRGAAYANHAAPFYVELMSPFEEWMSRDLGFLINDCFAIAKGYSDCLSDRFQLLREATQELIDKIWAGFKAQEKGVDFDLSSIEPDERDFLRQISGLGRRRAFHLIQNREVVLNFSKSGSRILIPAEEIAQKCGLPLARVTACLEFFSLDFGDGSIPLEPQPVGPLRNKPVIRWKGAYIIVSPALLLWAAVPAVEASLNPDSRGALNSDRSLWEKYAEHKGELLETRGLELIAQALSGVQVERTLEYDFGGKRYELDGLLMFDKTLLIVEAKAGGFSELARKGHELRIQRDLKKLLVQAHEQALRASEYLKSTACARFARQDGTTLDVCLADYRRVILITLSLDSLSTFTTSLHRTAQTGLFAAGQLPWAVALFDLQVIVEHCDMPAQFIHYLRRRLELNRQTKLEAHDELDWLVPIWRTACTLITREILRRPIRFI